MNAEGIKIFEMNDCDCDYVAARTVASAKKCYERYTGIQDDDYEEGYPKELTEADIDKYMFTKGDNREGPTITFRERLAEMIADGAEFPTFFASTEF